MQDVIIIGGKGTAVSIAEQIDDARHRFGGQLRVRGFAIDDPSLGPTIAGFPVVCGTRDAAAQVSDGQTKLIFGLYRPDVMRERVALLESYGIAPEHFATFIHPLAYVARSATVGRGSVVFAHASVMKSAVVGDFCILNSHATVEHDTRVGGSCFVSAGACVGSEIRMGRGVFVGMLAALRPGIDVGDFGIVGMGSVVTRNVEEGAQVYGNPARRAR